MSAEGWVVIGTLLGAIVGSLSTVLFTEYLKSRRADRLDAARQDLLTRMLQDKRFSWRKLETLAHVIGADENTAKRLLLEVGARASEDGSETWGLISRNPLPSG
jgi:predicted acylesterase/phospholipase RssA